MYFRNYGVGKPWLEKYLRSPNYEQPSKSNLVNGHKIDQYEDN